MTLFFYAGMKVISSDEKFASLEFGEGQAKLELKEVGAVDHGSAFGRIAFKVPAAQLDTPGKATVQVVILADPDGHEICFVGSEAFDELSAVDPKGDELLNAAMEADKSKEWFKKKGIKKE